MTLIESLNKWNKARRPCWRVRRPRWRSDVYLMFDEGANEYRLCYRQLNGYETGEYIHKIDIDDAVADDWEEVME